MINVKTTKGTRYEAQGVSSGGIIVRQPSGKKRILARKDVGAAVFYTVVSQVLALPKEV